MSRYSVGRLQIAEARDDELSLYQAPLRGVVDDTLRDWHLLAIRRPHLGTLQIVAAGTSSCTQRWWLSAHLVGVDGLRRVRTRHGRLYDLGVRALVDVSPDVVERVAAAVSLR